MRLSCGMHGGGADQRKTKSGPGLKGPEPLGKRRACVMVEYGWS